MCSSVPWGVGRVNPTVLKHRHKNYLFHGVFRLPIAQMGKGWALQDSEAIENCLYSSILNFSIYLRLQHPTNHHCTVSLFVSVSTLTHTSHSVSFPKAPICKDFLCRTHKAWVFLAKISVAFLQQMLCRLIWENKCWKLCDPRDFPFVSVPFFKSFPFCLTVAQEASEKIESSLAAFIPTSSTSGHGGRWFACGIDDVMPRMYSLCSCEQMFLNQPIFYWEILTLALSRIAPRISSVFSKRCTAKNSSGRSGDGGQWGSSPDSGVLIQVGIRKIPSPCSTQQGYFLHILPFSS